MTEELAAREVELLQYLIAAQGRPIPREELLRQVWKIDPDRIETRTVDTHVKRLREKLGDRNPNTRPELGQGQGAYLPGRKRQRPVRSG